MQQSQAVLSVNQLATFLKFGARDCLSFEFPSEETARVHMRMYECYMAHWAYQCNVPSVRVSALDSGKSWNITARDESDSIGTQQEVTPMNAFQSNAVDHDPNYLLVAEQRLTAPLVAALVDLQQNPGIRAIVKWETQKQVIMTADCNNIPIGDSLEECLNFSRYEYWYRPDLDDFLRRCQQELRQDGSNTIQQTYRTFDPTTGGDWIECTVEYHMVDAGRLGFYQVSRNLDYRAIAAPTDSLLQR